MENLYDTLITDAFVRLCQKKALTKITIQDIANESNVARRTIYNHFEDKYAIMRFIYERRITEARELFDQSSSIAEPLTNYLNVCYKYPTFYKSLISYKGQDDYIKNLIQDVSDGFTEIIRVNVGEGYLTEDILFQIRVYVKSFASNFVEWLQDGTKISADLFAFRMLKCIPKELSILLDVAQSNRKTRTEASRIAAAGRPASRSSSGTGKTGKSD